MLCQRTADKSKKRICASWQERNDNRKWNSIGWISRTKSSHLNTAYDLHNSVARIYFVLEGHKSNRFHVFSTLSGWLRREVEDVPVAVASQLFQRFDAVGSRALLCQVRKYYAHVKWMQKQTHNCLRLCKSVFVCKYVWAQQWVYTGRHWARANVYAARDSHFKTQHRIHLFAEFSPFCFVLEVPPYYTYLWC